MTKADLIDSLATEFELSKRQIGEIIDTLLDEIKAALQAGDKVQLIPFGSFVVRERKISPTLAYYVGSTATGTSTAIAPTAAGTYTVVASFGPSANYTAANSSAVTFTIAKATPTVTVNPLNVISGTVLANGQLSGTATVGSTTVPGNFTFTTAAGTTVTTSGSPYTESVTFTPGPAPTPPILQQ